MKRRLCRALWLCMALLLAQTAHAECKRTAFTNPANTAAIPLPFGRINLARPSDPALQPEGSLLASIVVPPTGYTYAGATSESVLWTCDKADFDSGEVYFLVSTNADSRFGGFHDIGRADGLADIYATWFKHVGLRTSMDGVVLSRYWKRLPLKTYDTKGDKIHIRLQDIPPLHAELYHLSQETPTGGRFETCAGYHDTSGIAHPADPKPRGTAYLCTEPNAYLQLHGPGIEHDEDGEDHAETHWTFWQAYNGLAWRLYQSVSLSAIPTCVVRSATPHVHFDPISVQQLQAPGGAAQAHFNIVVDCNPTANPGVNERQTAMGVQVSPGAFAAAQGEGLASAGGVDYLLSDHYGTDASLAKGVGIALYDAGGHPRRFVGQPGTVGRKHPVGTAAGWYPVSQGAVPAGASAGGDQRLQLDFIAKLVKLPNAQDITPGKVRATAHVLVKVQ